MPQHKSIKKVAPKEAMMMSQKEMAAMMAQAHNGKIPAKKMPMGGAMKQKGKIGY